MKNIMIALACLALAACHPFQPQPDYGRCTRSHTEDSVTLIPVYGTNGSISYTYWPTSETVCDEHQFPLGDGPAYHEDVKRYEREMVEWRKDHPND